MRRNSRLRSDGKRSAGKNWVGVLSAFAKLVLGILENGTRLTGERRRQVEAFVGPRPTRLDFHVRY